MLAYNVSGWGLWQIFATVIVFVFWHVHLVLFIVLIIFGFSKKKKNRDKNQSKLLDPADFNFIILAQKAAKMLAHFSII